MDVDLFLLSNDIRNKIIRNVMMSEVKYCKACKMKKIALILSLLWSSLTFGDQMSEAELIAMAKQSMTEKNDVSSLELNDMYGRPGLIILPFSGFVWADVIKEIPPQFLYNLTSQFKTRNTSLDLITTINDRYLKTSYEESSSLVTRTSNNYTFCFVDDGLRKEFENTDGSLKPYFAGLLPLYFQKDDLFNFIRHHESSHCLDNEFDGTSDEQKFLSVMLNETRADLTATLVDANRQGNFDLFFNLIRPMRMTSVFDIEHTTEDTVQALISNLDPVKLKGLPFSKILLMRDSLIAKMETKEMIGVLLRNAYEKEQIGLYLVQKFRDTGQVVDSSVQNLLQSNQKILDSMIPSTIVASADLDRRYNDMVSSVLDNHVYYKEYIDRENTMIMNFKSHIASFNVEIKPDILNRISSIYPLN